MRNWMRRRVERHALLMEGMLRRYRVDPASASRRPRAFIEAGRRCIWCAQSQRCAEWLGTPSGIGGAMAFRCPNEGLFVALRSEATR